MSILVRAGAGVPVTPRGIPVVTSAAENGLSAAQRAPILDRRPRVLVSAAAGSGKTRLLVADFVQALVDEHIPLEQLVAVTFTRKAGAELASRIRSSLREYGRGDLALSLDRAAIGTIHSFCRRLLKDRALEAGVDPTFGVLESEGAELVKEELSAKVWADQIERADEPELEVLACFGNGLRRGVVPLYDKLRGGGQERPSVRIDPGPSRAEARSRLTLAVRLALAAGEALARRSVSLESDLSTLRECLAWLCSEEVAGRLEADLVRSAGFFPSRRTPAMEEHFAPVRAALTGYRLRLAEARLEPLVAMMNSLLARFHDSFEAYKRERSLLDFADLELRALALLTAPDGGVGVLSSGARMMIDEFQDTNELQFQILERAGAGRLLMVGDERQSIYRFRGADVGVFRRRVAALTQELAGSEGGGFHRLDVNYRSRPELVAFINRLFAHELFFGESFVPLRCGRGSAEVGAATPHPAAEVLVVERLERNSSDGASPYMQEAEALAVASRVGLLVDGEGWEPRDVVVLTPAQTHVVLYQRALLARGVEVYVVGGKGYYTREEVADITALLRLLVNPHDDLALATALRSPLCGLSDDGLYLLGRAARQRRADSLWDVARAGTWPGLGNADRCLVSQLTTKLARLRRRVGRPGLARLIDDAVSECGYDLHLLGLPQGKRRFANVRKLMRMAEEYEALEGPDLAGFVAVVQTMGDLGDNEGSAPTLAEGENVVRVMTVHQAKGLEFPVVVLAGLGSDVPRGSHGDFVVGDDGSVGVFLKGTQRDHYETQDLCWGPAVNIVTETRAREQEEDVRLLYVAMTRARERLVLVGAQPLQGKLSGCRIGRIVHGLGMDELPAPGITAPIEGLDAFIARVKLLPDEGVATAVTMPDWAPLRRSDPGVDRGIDSTPEPCPQFMEDLPARARPQKVSFSALAAYQKCPRGFYLERMLGLGPNTRLGINAAASDDQAVDSADVAVLDEPEIRAGRAVGLLVHALLERSALEQPQPTSEMMRLRALECARENGLVLSGVELERAVALALAFWRSPLAGRSGLQTAAHEVPFFFLEGEMLVTGIIDLLWKEEDAWHIVDFKTNALTGRSPAEMAAQYDLQSAVYSLAALRAGARAVELALLFLERPKDPVTCTFRSQDLGGLEGAIAKAAGELSQGSFAARTGEGCAWCSVAEVCGRMGAVSRGRISNGGV